jgi:low temperature requirement protein LtrA
VNQAGVAGTQAGAADTQPGSAADQLWHRTMTGRDPDEEHRAATPLELLFDLCFVIAVAQASILLHEGLAHGDGVRAILGYLFVFFAIWWPWMNFSWFASAYDTDDAIYRLLAFVQIAGVLVVAAGVHELMTTPERTPIAVIGYVIMRVALVLLWLRAAREDPAGRPVTLRYAVGVGAVQVLWVIRLVLFDANVGLVFLIALAALELLVPVWAERGGRPTPWHPEHITERYQLFTIIVLGECVLAAFTAVHSAFIEAGASAQLGALAVGGLLLVFSLWWAYFKAPAAVDRGPLRWAFLWGYGHYFIFAAAAAVGAGIQLVADSTLHPESVGPVETALAVAIPAVIYLVAVALLHHHSAFFARSIPTIVMSAVLLVAAFAAGTFGASLSVFAMGIIASVFVGRGVIQTHRRALLEAG